MSLSKKENSTFRDIRTLSNHARSYVSDLKEKRIFISGENVSYIDAGRGDVVILLHGLDGSRHVWRLLIQQLKKRYRVISFDIPGVAVNSSLNRLSTFSLLNTVDIVDEFVNRLSISRFHLAGLSAGSTLSAYYALKYRNKVKSLTLFSMPTLFKEANYIQGSIEETAQFLIPSDLEGVDRLVDYLFYSRPNLPSVLLKKFLEYSIKNRALRLRILEQFIWQTVQLVPRLTHLKLPCLLVYGNHDQALPEQSVNYLRVNVSDLSIHVIQDAGHFSIIEKPGQTASVYIDFLNTHVQSSMTNTV